MGVRYDKWTDLEIHVDDNTSTSLTKGFIVGYRLVRLMDGRQVRTDKQAKNGTTVRGIIKRKGSEPALFIIKEGKVTANEAVTGDYEMIGIGLILKTNSLILSRNGEREQDQIGENEDYATTIKDDTQHNYSNCTVNAVSGQLSDASGNLLTAYNSKSTSVFHAGARMILGTDYTETPGAGKITPLTFSIDTTTIVDCDRLISASAPAAMIYEKIP